MEIIHRDRDGKVFSVSGNTYEINSALAVILDDGEVFFIRTDIATVQEVIDFLRN
jgi:prophage antirepressor-like protein